MMIQVATGWYIFGTLDANHTASDAVQKTVSGLEHPNFLVVLVLCSFALLVSCGSKLSMRVQTRLAASAVSTNSMVLLLSPFLCLFAHGW